ncbi:MAG: tetratricopeptide repeat protein [Planctomycetota bacterium]|jgi:hypothetical protein
MTRRLNLHLILVAMLAFLLAPASDALAQQKKLRVGDEAPSVDVAEWVNGSFSGFQSGTTYFLFFIKELPRDLDGMLVLSYVDWLAGISAIYDFETMVITSSKKSEVQSLISRIEGRLTVPIGIDERDRTRRSWVEQSDSPSMGGVTLFIVDAGGKVQYAGAGGEEDREEIFPLILSQRFDAGLLRRTEGLRRAKDTAREVGNWRLYEQHHAELMELDKRVFAMENIDKFESLLLDRADRDAAYAFVGELSEQYGDDPRFLLDLAVFIADSPKLTSEQRDLDAAMALVKQAGDSMSDANPRPLAVQALVLLRQGDAAGAVRMQRRAFRVAPTAMKPGYQRTLESYQKIRDQSRGG